MIETYVSIGKVTDYAIGVLKYFATASSILLISIVGALLAWIFLSAVGMIVAILGIIVATIDLLLCDTYQMDAWFPFGWKWKKELEKSSYSVWAIDELKRYIVGRLYPKKSGSVEDFITFVGDFRRIMNQFSKINPDNNFMFSVAADISTDVLDLLHAMK